MKSYIRLFVIVGALLLLVLAVTPLAAQEEASVRIGYFAFDPNEYDTYIDGELASFSPGWSKVGWGVPLIFAPMYRADCATPYMMMDSGVHSLAFVPIGDGMDAAILGPQDVTLEAGHGYSLAIIGDMDNLSLITIDETEALQGVEVENNHVAFLVHNILGAPPLDIVMGDEVTIDNLEYGDWGVNVISEELMSFKAVTVEEEPVALFESDENLFVHGVSELSALSGSYPGEVGTDIFWDFNWNYSGDVTVNQVGEVAIGDVVAGEIIASTHRSAYELRLDTSTAIDVFALGSDKPTFDPSAGAVFDPTLYIYDENGRLLFWNDEGTGLSVHKGGEAGVFDAALEGVPLNSGVYSIQVAGYGDFIAGPYGLIVRETPGM